MSAYVIFFVDEISDAGQLKRYQRAAHPTLQRAGGSVTIAYGRQEVIEGPPLAGVVMVEFQTFEAAHDWYHSTDYQQASALRKLAIKARAVIVEGLPGAGSRTTAQPA